VNDDTRDTGDREQARSIVGGVRAAFDEGRTRPLAWRKRQLDGLDQALTGGRDALAEAMAADQGKPAFEAYSGDVEFPLREVRYVRRHVDAWARPRRVRLQRRDRPGRAWIVPEPVGVVLVIAPWNSPVQLLLMPVADALAAGNAVVAKPSELAPATSEVLAELLRTHLDPDAVAVVEGGVETATTLLAQRFDHILLTGSPRVGRVVAKAAAEHLTPVTLELGGKSPVIVGPDADIAVAARRISWGKWANAGQTCVAPDYVLAHRDIRDELVDALVATVRRFYGSDPIRSPDLARIINDAHTARLAGLLDGHGGRIVHGGEADPERRMVAPTIIVDPDPQAPVMQEEIFGPLLPVLTVEDLDEAVAFVDARPKPLALYVFSNDEAAIRRVVSGTSSGGVCINHTLLHIGTAGLPLGGVGESGYGRYRGLAGFETFSHLKPVLRKPKRPDLWMVYPPYTRFKQRLVAKWL
jgi:aldehyde dehydrogenase (NAD+)